MPDIYDPPNSNLHGVPGMDSSPHKFYVVGAAKFWILYLFTIGFYQFYWFYKNWSRYKERTQEEMWPFVRGIFSIFFVHALFREVDATLEAENRGYSWDSGVVATCYVVALIVWRVIGRFHILPDKLIIPLVFFFFLPLIGFLLFQAQRAINVACGDPKGTTNGGLDTANYLWIAVGFFVMLLALSGWYMIAHGLRA